MNDWKNKIISYGLCIILSLLLGGFIGHSIGGRGLSQAIDNNKHLENLLNRQTRVNFSLRKQLEVANDTLAEITGGNKNNLGSIGSLGEAERRDFERIKEAGEIVGKGKKLE